MATEESKSFEAALAELSAIVERLEREDVSLAESVELFKKGKDLERLCQTLLANAKAEIAAAERVDESHAASPPPLETVANGNDADDEVPF